MESVLRGHKEFGLTACCDSLTATIDCLPARRPDIVLIHLTERISLEQLGRIRSTGSALQTVLWGDDLNDEFAFQAMQLGVRGILPSHTSIDGLFTSLRNVHNGALCFEKELVDRVLLRKRVTLSKRQGQIVSLVTQGFKNKAIGAQLGITEGTVKVYLNKLFRKLGVDDRLELALYSLKNYSGGHSLVGTADGPTALPAVSQSFYPPQSRDRAPSHPVN